MRGSHLLTVLLSSRPASVWQRLLERPTCYDEICWQLHLLSHLWTSVQAYESQRPEAEGTRRSDLRNKQQSMLGTQNAICISGIST